MDYIKLSVIGSLIGTTSIVLVYIYLYFLYRERHIGMWALSWLFLLSRYVIFDSGLFAWKQSTVGLTIYQILIFASILLFVGGTYLFANKPLKKYWVYSTGIIAFLSFSMNVTSLLLDRYNFYQIFKIAGNWVIRNRLCLYYVGSHQFSNAFYNKYCMVCSLGIFAWRNIALRYCDWHADGVF